MNRLTGMRAYLCGAMDLALDGGVGWRQALGTWLSNKHGVIVLDPTRKPCDLGSEDMENREYRRQLKIAGDYETLAREMRVIRSVDLRLVDIADFLVVNLDLSVFTCGTMEEIFWANRCKRPILIHVEQGKVRCPDWLYGTLPHEHIFSEWDEIYDYLDGIADGSRDHKRFMYFHDVVHRKARAA